MNLFALTMPVFAISGNVDGMIINKLTGSFNSNTSINCTQNRHPITVCTQSPSKEISKFKTSTESLINKEEAESSFHIEPTKGTPTKEAQKTNRTLVKANPPLQELQPNDVHNSLFQTASIENPLAGSPTTPTSTHENSNNPSPKYLKTRSYFIRTPNWALFLDNAVAHLFFTANEVPDDTAACGFTDGIRYAKHHGYGTVNLHVVDSIDNVSSLVHSTNTVPPQHTHKY